MGNAKVVDLDNGPQNFHYQDYWSTEKGHLTSKSGARNLSFSQRLLRQTRGTSSIYIHASCFFLNLGAEEFRRLRRMTRFFSHWNSVYKQKTSVSLFPDARIIH